MTDAEKVMAYAACLEQVYWVPTGQGGKYEGLREVGMAESCLTLMRLLTEDARVPLVLPDSRMGWALPVPGR